MTDNQSVIEHVQDEFKFKVFHQISVHFWYFSCILEALSYILFISSHMYSVVDIGKTQYVKSKFKVFHQISVHFGYFLYISEVVGYFSVISSQTYSVVDIGNSHYVESKFKVFHKVSVKLCGNLMYFSCCRIHCSYILKYVLSCWYR